jgi:CubicO group peptidase (beta-lactamase class C family)
MATLLRRSAAVVVAGALATSAGAQAPPASDSIRSAMSRVFSAWSANDGPGCAVGVSCDGDVVFENGYGMANLELDAPITPASIFHVASISKQFTGMAVALLVRDGKLSLDDDIRRHLPELPDYGHRITVRHLLNHTSGLRDQWDLLAMARGGRFEENRITEPDVLEIVARQKALNFVPGTEYLYSNTGYTLAGTIVRRVNGKSLRAFADERIFKPLGMTHTHFHDDYTMVVKGRAAGYARAATAPWRVSLPNFDTYGATSLFTTVGDLLRWERNLDRPAASDTALLRELAAPATLASGDTIGYGLGISTEQYRGAWLVGHGGADAGYRAFVGRFPEHGLAVAVLCNAAPANPAALARGVADVWLGGRLAAVEPPARATATRTRAELAPFAGVYVHPLTGAPSWISLRGDTLVAGRTNGPALLPVADRRFRLAGQPVEISFTPTGELVTAVNAWAAPRPVPMKRHEPASYTRAQLAAYAGTYRSEELGATYTVAAGDSTLVLGARWGNDVTVRPAYGDTFVGQMLVGFTRDRSGRVNGMEMSTGRVRRVRFERVAR